MSEYKHKVNIETDAMMDDEGNIHIPEQKLKVDVSKLRVPKEWSKDTDVYVVSVKDRVVTTTCGVIRKILGLKNEHTG
jgi:uncharacterized protein YxjI